MKCESFKKEIKTKFEKKMEVIVVRTFYFRGIDMYALQNPDFNIRCTVRCSFIMKILKKTYLMNIIGAFIYLFVLRCMSSSI